MACCIINGKVLWQIRVVCQLVVFEFRSLHSVCYGCRCHDCSVAVATVKSKAAMGIVAFCLAEQTSKVASDDVPDSLALTTSTLA